jgi:hypothetical protein
MPLELTRENEMVGLQDKGKGKLRHSESFDHVCPHVCSQTNNGLTASSYYPGHGDDNILAQCEPDYPDTETEDNVTETAEDWMGDDLIAKGQPSRFSAMVATEVSVRCLFLCSQSDDYIATLVEGIR